MSLSLNLGLDLQKSFGIPRAGLLGYLPVSNGLVDTVGSLSIVYQSGDASTWGTTAVWGFTNNATSISLDTLLGGSKLFLGTTPIYRTWQDWMTRAWMNQTYLFMGKGGIAAYSASQTANVDKIKRGLKYLTVLPTDYLPSSLVHLWSAAFGAASGIGPNLSTNLPAGVIPGPNGTTLPNTSLGLFPGKGLFGGPNYTNLFTVAPTAPATKTLTAQKYCLQCLDGSVSCSYGTATPGSPLQFTATNGDTVFTPTSCTEWQLTASGGYAFPLIPHNTSVVSTASGPTYYQGWMMNQAILDALGGVGGNPAVFTLMDQTYIGVGSAEFPSGLYNNFIASKNNIISEIFNAYDGAAYIVMTNDGNNLSFKSSGWNAKKVNRHTVQTNSVGTQFRVGYQRLNVDMSVIDSSITWSSWVAFDGSMNPLTILKMFYNTTTPNYKQLVALSNQSLSDANIAKVFSYA